MKVEDVWYGSKEMEMTNGLRRVLTVTVIVLLIADPDADT